MPFSYMPFAASADSPEASYLPSCAAELALARSMRASWAAFLFSSRTCQVLRTEFCRARAEEKDTCQGLGVWFIAFRLSVDSISDCPPERNMIPGTAGGTRRLSIFRV